MSIHTSVSQFCSCKQSSLLLPFQSYLYRHILLLCLISPNVWNAICSSFFVAVVIEESVLLTVIKTPKKGMEEWCSGIKTEFLAKIQVFGMLTEDKHVSFFLMIILLRCHAAVILKLGNFKICGFQLLESPSLHVILDQRPPNFPAWQTGSRGGEDTVPCEQ